jgi:replicative DNA helicase
MEPLTDFETPVLTGGPVPPQSLEAERAVLCAMLLDTDAVEKALEVLGDQPRDFYRESHRKIFEAIVHLTDKNVRADAITLTEELGRRGQLDGVGGPSYITSLFEYAATSANVDHHARLVKEKGVLRRLIGASQKIAADAYAGREETSEIVDRAEQRIFEIADERLAKGFEAIRDLLTPNFQQIQTLYDAKQHITGVPTGFSDLDDRTAGFQGSDLIVIAGRPAMGKAQPLDARVLTTTGWKRMGELI